MKEAIDKAIENGFDMMTFFHKSAINNGFKVTSWYCRDTGIDFNYTYLDMHFEVLRSYYELVFGLDFVDKLLGDEPLCDAKKEDPDFGCWRCICNTGDGCEIIKDRRPPNCHLRAMSNPYISRDIEKLKEYIRKLI